MTVLNNSLESISRLIDSCWQSEQSFRSASAAVENNALKQLFSLYAQQRGRFAEELNSFTTFEFNRASSANSELPVRGSDSELVSACLEREKHTLELYRKVLAERCLPTKAHFLVSAQLALLERVHSRIETLRPISSSAKTTVTRRVL